MNLWIHDFLTVLAAAPTTQQNAAGQQPSSLVSFLPFILMFGLIYFMLIRPQQKRQKEQEKMVNALKTGDKVVAAGGIYGIITNVKDDVVSLRIADNVKIEVQKASVTAVTKPSEDKKEA